MNPKQPSPDNLFLRGHATLRQKRLTLPSSLMLLALIPLLAMFLLVLWFGQFQLQRDIARQADQAGSELTRQIATLVADPLAANDTLSLNIILAQWAQNPLIAHATLTGTNGRTVAEAGRRPGTDNLAPGQGRFTAAVHAQEELIGQLQLSLAREPFSAPVARLLKGLLWSLALLVLIAGVTAWRLGVNMRRILVGLGNWYADSNQPAPGIHRGDELGDLARRLAQRRITDLPPEPEPEPEPEPVLDTEVDVGFEVDSASPADDIALHDEESEQTPATAVSEADIGDSASITAELPALSEDIAPDEEEIRSTAAELSEQLNELPATPLEQSPASTLLAIRLGNLQSLHRLPRPRLLALLERYREQLEQTGRSCGGQLHTLMDGTSLILFHPDHPDQLGAALCCGELLRVLGHELQLQIADTGIALHIQLALCHTPCQDIAPDQLPEESTDCAQMLERLQHSRNLLLLDSELANSGLLKDKAILRRLASQPGSHCVERLLEPYQGELEKQLKVLGND